VIPGRVARIVAWIVAEVVAASEGGLGEGGESAERLLEAGEGARSGHGWLPIIPDTDGQVQR